MFTKTLAQRFSRYRTGYADIWHSLTIRPEYEAAVTASAQRILANRARYEAVQDATGVPWWFIAIVHKMEGNLDFGTHLHNGDSLTARTRQVPAGRPTTGSPPFTWEESAADALAYDGVTGIASWSVEVAAFAFEKFNGFGYQSRGMPSPYLWSFSTAYSRGKYVADGAFDASAVSRQSGAMVLLAKLMQIDPTLEIGTEVNPLPAPVDESEIAGKAEVKPLSQSRTIFGSALAWIGGIIASATSAVIEAAKNISGLITDASEQTVGLMAPVTKALGGIATSLPWIGLAMLTLGVLMAIGARVDAQKGGKIG